MFDAFASFVTTYRIPLGAGTGFLVIRHFWYHFLIQNKIRQWRENKMQRILGRTTATYDPRESD